MKIINVVSGSAALGGHCQVCDGLIGVPDTVLEFTYCDSSYGFDGYICKGCVDKAHKEMNKDEEIDDDKVITVARILGDDFLNHALNSVNLSTTITGA